MQTEIWKSMYGYEDIFEISNYGRVWEKTHVETRVYSCGPRKYFYPDKTHRDLKALGVSHTFIDNVPGAKVDIDYGLFFIGLDNSGISSENGWSINSEGRLAFYKGGEQIMSFFQTRLGRGKGRVFLEKIAEHKNFVPNTGHSFVRGTAFGQTFMVLIRYSRGVAKEEVNPFKEWNQQTHYGYVL